MVTMTCDLLLARHGKQSVLNRPLSVAYAIALISSAKTHYDWYYHTHKTRNGFLSRRGGLKEQA
jgi:hypothetical protein